jgi:hypothetical protein
MADLPPPRPTGPLNPKGRDGVVIIHEPPDEPMILSAEEADLSGIRLLDAAAAARAGRSGGEGSR